MKYSSCKAGVETPQEWLVKATRCTFNRFILAGVFGVLCATWSHAQDEVYQAPYAENIKVGQQASEQIEPADKHEGRYSVHKYEFKGKGPAHTMADVKKCELDYMGSRGSEVPVKV